MKITLVGGGNSTHVIAAVASSQGHKVSILTRQPERWSMDLVLDNEDPKFLGGRKDIGGRLALVTSDAAKAVPEADVIVLAGLPVHHYRDVLAQVCPHIQRKGTILGSVCVYMGFSWLVEEAMQAAGKNAADLCLYGHQAIPWMVGTREYGKRGAVFGAKRVHRVAVQNENVAGVDIWKVATELTGIPLSEMAPVDFLTCTLFANNPICHPPNLYGVLADWDKVTVFPEGTLPRRFYNDATDKSLDHMMFMHNEVLLIRDALKKVYPDNKFLDLVLGVQDELINYYGDHIGDKSTWHTTVRTNKAYSFHLFPIKKVEGGVVPDLNHKFFTTDLPYGLITFKDMAEQLSVETPIIDKLIMWNQRMIGKEMMVDGKLGGKDIAEAVRPSMYMNFGLLN